MWFYSRMDFAADCTVLPNYSRCIRPWPVHTLTPVKVWSASWSKRTKTKVPHVNVCAPSGWQAAAHSSTRCWQTLTLIQTGFPRGESPRVRGYICDRWPSSLRFSHLLLAHIWGGAASESVAFLICQAMVFVLWFFFFLKCIFLEKELWMLTIEKVTSIWLQRHWSEHELMKKQVQKVDGWMTTKSLLSMLHL